MGFATRSRRSKWASFWDPPPPYNIYRGSQHATAGVNGTHFCTPPPHTIFTGLRNRLPPEKSLILIPILEPTRPLNISHALFCLHYKEDIFIVLTDENNL